MVRPTLFKLTAICIASTLVPATSALSAALRAADVMNLFERAELTNRAELACANSTYTPCNKNGLPGNFCCDSNSECVAFNSGKSAICCPTGKDCSSINPISCDISRQNATAYPSSQLFTTDLTSILQTCDGKCCPEGYTCKNNMCTISSGSTPTSSPSSAASSPKSTPSTSNTSSSSKSSQPSSSATSSASKASSSAAHSVAATHGSQFTTAGVLVGFFSGLTVGVILAVAGICCFGRRNHKSPPPSPYFSSSVAATVSDPIYQPQGANAFRSDFLRRESKPKSPVRTSRVRSLFSRTPTMRSMRSIRSPRSRDAPVDGIGRSIPRTPVNQRSPEPSLKREPSMESIKIYSPPNGGLGRPNTTFTDMMADAGFKQGEPYLGSPGRGMPMP